MNAMKRRLFAQINLNTIIGAIIVAWVTLHGDGGASKATERVSTSQDTVLTNQHQNRKAINEINEKVGDIQNLLIKIDTKLEDRIIEVDKRFDNVEAVDDKQNATITIQQFQIDNLIARNK